MRNYIRRVLGRFTAGAALVLITAAPARAESNPATVSDDKWHFMIAPYMWFTGVNGDLSVKGLPDVPIDESFSDIIKNFHFGFMGHFEGRKDRWGFISDTLYVNLHAPVVSGAIQGRLDLEATVKLLNIEALGFYRVASGGRHDDPTVLDVLIGMRFYGNSAQLNATFPVSGGEIAGDKRTFNWVDAVTGLRFRTPLGSRFDLLGRADVAFFGSKVTWNLTGDLAFKLSPRWALGLGWRYLNVDYDKGEGSDRKLFDIVLSGARLDFAYAW
jgi:hypothetical protein